MVIGMTMVLQNSRDILKDSNISTGQTFTDNKCFILYGVKLLNRDDDILLTSHWN